MAGGTMERIIAALLVWAILLAPFVVAAPVGATVTNIQDRGSYTEEVNGGSLGTIAAGHVYEANLSYRRSTTLWAGIFGTISQTVVLSDGTHDFYTWSAGLDATKVLLSNKADVNWAGQFVGGLTSSSLISMGIWNSGDDSKADNFENTTTQDSSGVCNFVGISLAGGTSYYYATTGDGSDPTYWKSCYFAYDANTDGSAGAGDYIVVAGNVDTAGHTAYDGATAVNYQVMVPTNTTGIAYYVWVE